MEYLLNEDEQALRVEVREFADRVLAPQASENDEREEFSWETWRAMAALGLTGIAIDSAYGGRGGGYRQLAIAEEEVARGDASAGLTLLAHLSLATQSICCYGSEDQKLKYVPPLSTGALLGAWALTEPATSSDVAAIQTTATPRDGVYYLNGTKTFVTNGDLADHVVVFATQDIGLGSRGISTFVVEKGMPGCHVRRLPGKMGMRGSSTAEMVFQDAPVSQDNRLGDEGQGYRYAMETLDSSRIIVAAQCVGIGQAALEKAIKYAQQRWTFGRPIGQHQAIQFMLADMATEVHASRLATTDAATLKDKGLPFTKEASMAKLLASEMAVRVTDKALQIHGGQGYFKDDPVERYFRDARATTIYEGTSEMQRLIIARQILAQIPP